MVYPYQRQGNIFRREEVHLGVLAGLKERCHADQSNVIVPDYSVQFIVSGYLVCVLEHYHGVSKSLSACG